MTILLGVVAAFLLRGNQYNMALILVLAVYILMFHTAQFLLYIVTPERVAPSYRGILNSDNISNGMTYVLFGTIATGFGFMTGSRLSRTGKNKTIAVPLLPFTVKNTVMLFFVSMSVMFVYIFVLGFGNVGMFKTWRATNLLFGYLTLFLNDACVLVILYMVCIQKWEVIGRDVKNIVILSVILLALIGFVGGSRAGLVRPVLYLFFSFFAVKGDIRVPTEISVVVILAIIISFALFPYVTQLKRAWHSKEGVNDASMIMSSIEETYETREDDPVGRICKAANRLNGIAPISGILSVPEQHFRSVLSFTDNLKVIINKILPFANPFPDVISSSRLFNVILFNYSLSTVSENYHTQAYSAWGLAYAYFGYWGGLIAVFLMTTTFSIVYQKAAQTKSSYNAFWRTWVILFTYGWFRGFGYDNQFSTQRLFLTTGIGFVLAMNFIDRRNYFFR